MSFENVGPTVSRKADLITAIQPLVEMPGALGATAKSHALACVLGETSGNSVDGF